MAGGGDPAGMDNVGIKAKGYSPMVTRPELYMYLAFINVLHSIATLYLSLNLTCLDFMHVIMGDVYLSY